MQVISSVYLIRVSFSIGDTLCSSNEKFEFEGIPTFAPEHFARVRQVDTMKRKQFIKGVNQIAQEGAIQIFQEFNTGMEEIIVGVVGVLQFDVLNSVWKANIMLKSVWSRFLMSISAGLQIKKRLI